MAVAGIVDYRPAGGQRPRLQRHLRNLAFGINSRLANEHETPLARFVFIDVRPWLSSGFCSASFGGIHHPCWWALDVSVGKVQDLSA